MRRHRSSQKPVGHMRDTKDLRRVYGHMVDLSGFDSTGELN